jgi:hypothetical protein
MSLPIIARSILVTTIAVISVSAYADQFTLVCRFNAMNGEIVQNVVRNFVVDFERKTVDDLPAYITEDEIQWQSADAKQSTTTKFDRRTGKISASGSTGFSMGECAKPQKRQKPQ